MIYTTLKLEPGMTVPTVKKFEFNDYQDLERMIGGKLEMMEVNIRGHYYDIILDEEHKFKDLQMTLAMAHNSCITDIISGDIIFLKSDQEGRTISLDSHDVERIETYFNQNTMRYLDGDIRLPVYDWIR